jgi:hypothetical protein
MISIHEFVIKDKTEYYKKHVCNLTGFLSDPTDETKETVIFENGMEATFLFRLYYVDYITNYLHHIQIDEIIITNNNEDVQDEIIKRKIEKILYDNYFDETVLSTIDLNEIDTDA